MIRLPDHSFTSNPMFGVISQVGAVQPSPSYSQGEDIAFSVQLNLDDAPLDLNNYKLVVAVKKSLDGENTMYRQQVTQQGPVGYASVLIPAASSALLRPGTYYFSFLATSKLTGRKTVVMTGTFNVELSAVSPSPKMIPQDGELTADTEVYTPTSQISVAEDTGPDTPDISLLH